MRCRAFSVIAATRWSRFFWRTYADGGAFFGARLVR
jgi:hypothetical protein